MATSRYYSKDDEDTGASAAGGGGVLGGGGGGAPASGPAAGGSEGSGFVNLSKYLDANRGGSTQMAGAINQDLGTQVGASNEALSGITSAGVANAQGMDTAGVGVGTDISAEGEAAALGGIEQYGMSDSTGGSFDTHVGNQAGIQDYGSNLQNDQHTRQEAIQRLYGSGRSSGFGGLDAFLVAGDKSSGFAGGVDSELGKMGDIEAGRAEVSGAYDAANTKRAANTTEQYQQARNESAAATDANPLGTGSYADWATNEVQTGGWGEGEGETLDEWNAKSPIGGNGSGWGEGEGISKDDFDATSGEWGEGEGETLEQWRARTGR